MLMCRPMPRATAVESFEVRDKSESMPSTLEDLSPAPTIRTNGTAAS